MNYVRWAFSNSSLKISLKFPVLSKNIRQNVDIKWYLMLTDENPDGLYFSHYWCYKNRVSIKYIKKHVNEK